jgi:hypothetical protein
LKLSLIENLTLNDFTIQTFTISFNQLSDAELNNLDEKKCITVTGGKLKTLADDKNLTIKNPSGDTINYTLSGNMEIGPLDSSTSFIKVYYASDFQNHSPEWEDTGCVPITQNQYEIRAVTEKEIIASTNIGDICGLYNEDYENLKDYFGVPSGSDFSFTFTDVEGIEICPNSPLTPPQDTSIYVGEIPIQYIDEEASVKIGFIVIKVW